MIFKKENLKEYFRHLTIFAKWIIYSVLTGILVGLVGTGFFYCMAFATEFRENHFPFIFFLPVAGLLIVFLYRFFKQKNNKGTNLVISAIRSEEDIPLSTAPLIFISTVITHLFGGSAGREGAALQLGGSIGNYLGKLFRFDNKDKRIVIMCGMSAAFSALFGTPLAAAVFPMEVVSVGIMYYAALVPCALSSLTAGMIASYFGIIPEAFLLTDLPAFHAGTGMLILLLGMLCAIVSILFCVLLHHSEILMKYKIHNAYLRIMFGGLVVVVLTLLTRTTDYNGAGMQIIERAVMEGKVKPEAFILKMLFTAFTLSAGYKGGEIVPSFFVGASFGCLFGNIIGFSPSLCAAAGMAGVFCGVTNSPITSLFISFELFGFEGMPYFLIVIAVCYMLSDYYGLYHSQKIMYSKYRPTYINRKSL